MEFITLIGPTLILIATNIITLIRKKGFLLERADSFIVTLLMEVMFGGMLYAGVMVVEVIITLFEGTSFFEGLFAGIMMLLYFLGSYVVLLLPVSIVFSIIIKAQY